MIVELVSHERNDRQDIFAEVVIRFAWAWWAPSWLWPLARRFSVVWTGSAFFVEQTGRHVPGDHAMAVTVLTGDTSYQIWNLVRAAEGRVLLSRKHDRVIREHNAREAKEFDRRLRQR